MSKKEVGGSRVLKNGSAEYRRRENEVIEMLKSGRYSSVVMTNKGGYVAIENSTMAHKPEELEAAQILADKGYKVILKDEGSTEGKTPDGYVFSLSYEQRTPRGGTADNFKKALSHAASKPGTQVAVVYMKQGYSQHTRQSVEDGIKLFEQHSKKRFQKIIVVSDNGHIHRHIHNDV